MSFEHQKDTIRPEITRGQTGTIPFYPTVDGQRVRANTPANYSIFDISSTAIASGTIAETTVTLGAETVSRFDVPVPAINDLDEDYRAELRWVDAATSVQHTEVVLFDVVLAPLGETVSYSDLQEEVQDVAVMLKQFGERLGESGTDQAKRNAAMQVLGRKARMQLISWLRQRERPRPHMILDRYALNPIERYIALRELFLSQARQPEDGDGQADQSYRNYRDLARSRFDGLRIKYSSSEDLEPDSITEGFNVIPRTRVQSGGGGFGDFTPRRD